MYFEDRFELRNLIISVFLLLFISGSASLISAQTATPTPQPTATATATQTATPVPNGCYWRHILKAKDANGQPYFSLGNYRELFISRNEDGSLSGFLRYRVVVAATGEKDPGMPDLCHMPLTDADIREIGNPTLQSLSAWMLAKVKEHEGITN